MGLGWMGGGGSSGLVLEGEVSRVERSSYSVLEGDVRRERGREFTY